MQHVDDNKQQVGEPEPDGERVQRDQVQRGGDVQDDGGDYAELIWCAFQTQQL